MAAKKPERTKLPERSTTPQVYRDHIPSLADLIQICLTKYDRSDAGSSHKPPDQSWDGGANWQQTTVLMRTGWTDKAEALEQRAIRLAAAIKTERYDLRARIDCAGDDCDVGLYLTGEPEYMTCYEPVLVAGKGQRAHNVELFVALESSCTIPAYCIENRGLFVYLLARSLMLAGINVGITLYHSLSHGQHRGCNTARMKDPDQYLDTATLAFWLVHPAAQRRAGFAWSESRPLQERADLGFYAGGGYGHPEALPDEVRGRGIDLPAIIPANRETYETEAKVLAGVKELLRAQGVVIE